MRFDFYSLSRWSLEDAIPRILDKIIEKDKRALILTSSEEEAEDLCENLWSSSVNKWLGHGTIKDGNPLDQRVFITNDISNANKSNVLILTNFSYDEKIFSYERCISIFSSDNSQAIDFSKYIDNKQNVCSFELHYWKQKSDGKWTEEISL